MRGVHLGIDCGSVTTKGVALDEAGDLVTSFYARNHPGPIDAIAKLLCHMRQNLGPTYEVMGVGATGSGRELAAALVGADFVINEITAHAVATLRLLPQVRTIIEIGGQDSKLILLDSTGVVDFSLNNICAAGTGSFLDHQAERMGITVEQLGQYGAFAERKARISGSCAVLAETDVIQKQQMGYPVDEICAGLCDTLARSFLTSVARGKTIRSPVAFQGGVAANEGMRRAFESVLSCEIHVPSNFAVMGALGAANLAMKKRSWERSGFRGFDPPKAVERGQSFTCDGCENHCEIVSLRQEDQVLAYLGSRCGKWSVTR